MVTVSSRDFDEIAFHRHKVVAFHGEKLLPDCCVGGQAMSVGRVAGHRGGLKRRLALGMIFVPPARLAEREFVDRRRHRHRTPAEGEING